MKKIIFMSVIALGLLFTYSCTKSNENPYKQAVAKFNGEVITYGDIAKKYPELAKRISEYEDTIYRYKKFYAERYIDDKILEAEAKKHNLPLNKFLQEYVYKNVKPVTDDDIQRFAKERHFTPEQTKQLKERIRFFLQRQNQEAAKQAYLNKVKSEYKISIVLPKPYKERKNIKIYDNDIKIGNPNAKVVLVDFDDFQCPFCKRSAPAVSRIVKEYKDKILYVFKNFPLSFHSRARAAANAALCAHEQGKFMEYHDILFANQNKYSDDDFVQYAKKLNLNIDQFKKCYNSKKYDSQISRDIEDGRKYGVSGTPTYFINGISHVGAITYDALKQLIENELN